MDIRDIIPKHKDDEERLDKLKQYSFEEIKPIIPDLLKWLQDCNWPVAHPVSLYLESVAHKITSEIIDVLRTDDDMWKYWCLGIFGFDTEDIQLKEEIKRIAFAKCNFECEAKERAIEILEYWKSK